MTYAYKRFLGGASEAPPSRVILNIFEPVSIRVNALILYTYRCKLCSHPPGIFFVSLSPNTFHPTNWAKRKSVTSLKELFPCCWTGWLTELEEDLVRNR